MLKPHIPVDHGYLCLAYPFYIHNFLSRFQSGYKRVLVDDHSNIIRVQSNVCTERLLLPALGLRSSSNLSALVLKVAKVASSPCLEL